MRTIRLYEQSLRGLFDQKALLLDEPRTVTIVQVGLTIFLFVGRGSKKGIQKTLLVKGKMNQNLWSLGGSFWPIASWQPPRPWLRLWPFSSFLSRPRLLFLVCLREPVFHKQLYCHKGGVTNTNLQNPNTCSTWERSMSCDWWTSWLCLIHWIWWWKLIVIVFGHWWCLVATLITDSGEEFLAWFSTQQPSHPSQPSQSARVVHGRPTKDRDRRHGPAVSRMSCWGELCEDLVAFRIEPQRLAHHAATRKWGQRSG